MRSLFGFMLTITMLLGSALMAENETARIITVSGCGEIMVDADQLSFSFTIESRDKSLDNAKAENDQKLAKVEEIFKLFSLPPDQISISAFNVSPLYDFRDGDIMHIKGFAVSRAVRVKLKNLEIYETIIDALIEAEIYQIGSLDYELSNSAAIHAKARENALNKAREKAEQMAAVYGMKIGNVISISESGSESWYGRLDYGFGSANVLSDEVSSGVMDDFKGRKTIKAKVLVKFELVD